MSREVSVIIGEAVVAAMVSVLGPDYTTADPVIRRSTHPDHGDFQANCAMAIGKQIGQNPRELADSLIEAIELDGIADSMSVAGPGFINIRLRNDAVTSMLEAMDNDGLGVEPDPDTHPIVIDLCGVNVAKQLHVGHLRSTIIGDALARILERLGRVVHRENHLGDWGLPIAMVLHQLMESGVDLGSLDLEHLNVAYRDAQLTAKGDVRGLETACRTGAGPHRIAELEDQQKSASRAQEAARQTLVSLQQGDESLVAAWQNMIDCTMRAVLASLELLNVKVDARHNRGESSYRDHLAPVVDEFIKDSLAEEDEGALVVRFADRDRPLLIRKSDGGFLYATTDIAAIRCRVGDIGADRIIYVVDARQRDHFRDVFDAARLIGWDHTPDGTPVEFVHIPFGSVLGKDKRPLKTRSGENVTLASLIHEAIDRGVHEVESRATNPDAPTHGLPEDQLHMVGRQIGIGAIKYADLSNDLVRDYVFDMDRMIAFEGNTGPYIQYACARIGSMLRKAENGFSDAPFHLQHDAERALALMLLQYGPVVHAAASSLEPHRLCTYLHDLAESFSSLYQTCPVLKSEDGATRASRLRLSMLTRRVLVDGLDILGIETPDRM
ncbi:MAG: arginine--tRNA ligase [Phycisphaerales bacterium]|nr:arginine--tRNA ligase [Phycisphaerales bacterium]